MHRQFHLAAKGRRGTLGCGEARGGWWLAGLLAIATSVQGGCSSGNRLDVAPVCGKVTLDGKPVSAGIVVFTPERGRGARGQLASDGSFVLSTYGEGDGAIVGLNKIAVAPPPEDESGRRPPGYAEIPQHYHNGKSSGLEGEVKAGRSNVFDLKLHSSQNRDA